MSAGANAIEVRDLRKTFGAFQAVRGVSFDVKRGEIFGYLGANGAGKSTTIRILCGLMAPTSGTAVVAGHDVARDPEGVRLAVGYMSQKFSLYQDLTARENLDFFGGAYRIPRARRLARASALLAQVGLADALSSGATVASMPGGMRQRLALAAALLHGPDVVFLDEPTAGVDPEARRTFWRIIRELAANGTTVFVTTHYMDEAEYCHRVGLMVGGELVALDTPDALKRAHVPGRLFAVYGDGLSRDAARAAAGVRDVAPFGAGLHVRGDDALTPSALTDALAANGARNLSVTETDATLEDVFLAVAGRTPRAPVSPNAAAS